MEWIKYSEYNLPPQGLKILCFRKGDLWVARRICYREKDYWIEIPYGGEKGAILTHTPTYWMRLDLPEGCTGYMKVGLDGSSPITLDELQKIDPESHEEIAKMMVESTGNTKKPKRKK